MLEDLKEKVLEKPIIKIAFIFAVLLLIGGGLYIIQKKKQQQSKNISQKTETSQKEKELEPTNPLITTPDEAANQKVYQNDKYGFSFNYHKDWVLREEKATENQKGTNYLFSVSLDEKEVNRATLSVYDNPKSLSLENWIKEYYREDNYDNKAVTINGQEGQKYRTTQNSRVPITTVITTFNKKVLVIRTAKDDQEFNELLSSLEFKK